MKLHFVLITAGLTSLAFWALFSGEPNSSYNDKLVLRQDPIDKTAIVFEWRGEIEFPMARTFSREFDRIKDSYSRIVIDLDSPGGNVREGERVIRVIRRIKRSHRVRTYVGPDNDCLSMCVPIYLQGHLRVAAASSRWMFHEPVAVDKYTGKQQFVYEFEKRQFSQYSFYRFFYSSDMDPEWRDNLSRQWRYGDIWKTGRELKDERSNVVMIIE